MLATIICIALQGEEGRLYEDLSTYDLMKPVVEELLAEYNSKKKPMNLVFFDDAIEHLTRIHRILRLQQVSFSSTSTCREYHKIATVEQSNTALSPWIQGKVKASLSFLVAASAFPHCILILIASPMQF